MKHTIAKAAIIALCLVGICTLIYAGFHKVSPAPQIVEKQSHGWQFIDVDEYEIVRAGLYDAALNLCIDASNGSYVWEHFVSDENKRIILNYRVPSLEVLISAINQMDCDGCLSDSFDEPLVIYERALYKYNKLTNCEY